MSRHAAVGPGPEEVSRAERRCTPHRVTFIVGLIRFDGHPRSGVQPQEDVHHGERGKKKPRPRRSFTPESFHLDTATHAYPRTQQAHHVPRGCYIKSSCLREILGGDLPCGLITSFEELKELSADCTLEAALCVPRGLSLTDSPGNARCSGSAGPAVSRSEQPGPCSSCLGVRRGDRRVPR